LPIAEKIFARVYFVMSWVTVKVPAAPEPFACIHRSGITSRSKLANFSRNHTSWSNAGPFGPAVVMFWLSTTGAPNAVVNFFITPFLYVNRMKLPGGRDRPNISSCGESRAFKPGSSPVRTGSNQISAR
jgi:hypothetical protein